MNFKNYIEKRKELIDRALDEYLPKGTERPKILHRAMRYSVFSGGKRIRPIIAIESCALCGGKTKDGLTVGCAMELVHTYSLIHDDLPAMDDDDYRRGRPACHKAFGEANAILAGDGLLTLAFNVLSKGLEPKKAVTAIRQVSEAIGTRGMVGGQVLDLELRNRKKDKKTLDYINRLKTSMLFEASAISGAIVAGAGKKALRAVEDYGAYLGMIFQITDDIIDGEYDASIRGKALADHDAKILAKKAKSSLKMFGGMAGRLLEIADYVLKRTW